MTGRSVPEWIGKTPDTAAPPRVRVRVFDARGGVCHLTGRKIQPGEAWELEHVTALILGGENRESNLAPALKADHKVKTAEDVKAKAISDRKRKKHLGIKSEARRKLPGSRDSGWKAKVGGGWERRDA